ncbi:hypothetical protein HB943_03260 [Listeria weihenstephanensis]|uniref:DUF4944 domain-containing protein n=1 Tax=Listeria weihenstephanensis TaxID=1006155 RepID=A0A1S7FTC2_9LIST|nr:hypothetical protein [Listeria weihenstephanensis]AQY50642.1 hypothetical protein UE46_06075 [Listeria weihenstephanensis]MBC1499608.1 hypothetical protein [Listeria weihenstephanensis]
MTKKKYRWLIVIIFLGSWITYSLLQPAIVYSKGEYWKVVYKPRAAGVTDSTDHPWSGYIKWRGLTEPKVLQVDMMMDGESVNFLEEHDLKNKKAGNFDGRTIPDPMTFYDGPDIDEVQAIKITWEKGNKIYEEVVKLKMYKRSLIPFF